MMQQSARELKFEWDDDKAAKNLEKHKITFRQAKKVGIIVLTWKPQ